MMMRMMMMMMRMRMMMMMMMMMMVITKMMRIIMMVMMMMMMIYFFFNCVTLSAPTRNNGNVYYSFFLSFSTGLPSDFLKTVNTKLKGLVLNIKEFLLTEKVERRNYILTVSK